MMNDPAISEWQGRLILASPILEDDTFDHSVVIITNHTPTEGSKGFIINNPLGKTIQHLLPKKRFPQELKSIEVFNGGPVDQDELTLVALTTKKTTLLYRAGINAEEAIDHLQTPGTLVRGFMGHCSWVKGQIEHEFMTGSWVTISAHAPLLGMIHDRQLWLQLMNAESPMHALLARAPKHYFLN
ncbi:MAG: YqgE/AlgH family protein [Akkermansia sp.]